MDNYNDTQKELITTFNKWAKVRGSDARKMIATLEWGRDDEIRRGVRLTEFRFIDELTEVQRELFDSISTALEMKSSTLATKLIKNGKI